MFFARLLLEISGATISAVALTTFFVIIGLMDVPQNLSLVLAGWIFLAFFGTGLGLVIGALSERSEAIDRLWHTIAYILFPLSGAVFMVEWLPVSAQKLILLLPMVHGVEMLRAGYFGSLVKPHYDVEYMVIADLVLLFLGLLLTRDASKRVEPE